MDVRTFPKGHDLLREGMVASECYFVLKGCIRQYCLVDGDERTDQFYTEDQWVVSMASFSNQTPATHYWTCCEDCLLVVGNASKENALYARFPRFESISGR